MLIAKGGFRSRENAPRPIPLPAWRGEGVRQMGEGFRISGSRLLSATKLLLLCAGIVALNSVMAQTNAEPACFRLVTLDPGHFHASLVQKFMYLDVDPVVHVYAPAGEDL